MSKHSRLNEFVERMQNEGIKIELIQRKLEHQEEPVEPEEEVDPS